VVYADAGNQQQYAGGVTAQRAAEYEEGGSTAGGGVKYLVGDHLGSTRAVLDAGGVVVKRYDFQPFGAEIGRTGNGYDGADAVKLKFTGKERDVESGLDYLGARYYGAVMGRFASPDPRKESTKILYSLQWSLSSLGRA